MQQVMVQGPAGRQQHWKMLLGEAFGLLLVHVVRVLLLHWVMGCLQSKGVWAHWIDARVVLLSEFQRGQMGASCHNRLLYRPYIFMSESFYFF